MRASLRIRPVWVPLLLLAGGLLCLASCRSTGSKGGTKAKAKAKAVATGSQSKIRRWEAEMGPVPSDRRVTPVQLLKETGLVQSLLPPGKVGRRWYRPMRARYITIHSTQNYSAGAWQHSLALRRGALKARRRPGGNRIGFLTWHFTVEPRLAVQHLPTNEQGEHADFNGPGNNYSVGIEMCEHRGSSLAKTIDNTAKLTAYLMYAKGIPLNNVVPHYHWPRKGASPQHKDCPHFLLENGRPGRTWNWFLDRVRQQYSRLIPGPAPKI